MRVVIACVTTTLIRYFSVRLNIVRNGDWKTFRSFYITRYMKFEEGGIICRRTALVEVNNRKRFKFKNCGYLDCMKCRTIVYPGKHRDNIINAYPASLFQQALHVVLKSKV